MAETNRTALDPDDVKERLQSEHRAEVEYTVGVLESLWSEKHSLKSKLQNATSDRVKLHQTEQGWHRWLVWPVLLIGAMMEWNVATLVAKTVFGQTQTSFYLFAAALAICGVTIGWFIGRVLRVHQAAGSQRSSARRFAVIAITVIALFLVAAFVLRMQAAEKARDIPTITIIGQALITTVLSALGIVIAAGVEFFREGDLYVDARNRERQYEKRRDTIDSNVTYAERDYLRAVRVYQVTMASVGGNVDRDFLNAMATRIRVAETTPAKRVGESSDSHSNGQSWTGEERRKRTVFVDTQKDPAGQTG